MNRPVYAIFVAGGVGTRMGSQTPKQFLELDGKPILQWTIERFLTAVDGLNVITALPRAHFDTWKNLCFGHGLNHPQQLTEGGITRFHSVRNALARVPEGAVVIVHDGVRPFTSERLITDMLSRMSDCPALIPAIPVTGTLRSIRDDVPAPDRSSVVEVQTPQMFHSEILKEAYRGAYRTSFTDDASVVECFGCPVLIHPGEKMNIKITTPEDLILAHALLVNLKK